MVTLDDVEKLPLTNREKGLLETLIEDLEKINEKSEGRSLYIDRQDFHNEYSPERIDPCPDYYGYYTLRWKHNDEMVGVEMTIEDLDMVLCTLYNYIIDD